MFTHLHIHTQYSLLEGAIRIKDLAAALKEKGYDSCAITDHGNMFGAIEFYHTMKAANLKPIIGVGASVAEESEQQLNYYGRKKSSPGQIQLLCLNRAGYQNLSFMLSLSYTDGKVNGTPCINYQLLEKYNEGLIALSGGMNSQINRFLLNGRIDEARRIAIWYRDLFCDRYYIELQNTGLPDQKSLNSLLSSSISSAAFLKRSYSWSRFIRFARGSSSSSSSTDCLGKSIRDLISARKAAITRYSAASSNRISLRASMYCIYCFVI